MAALKVGILNQETESRNGIRNQISIIEKYYINIPWHWNVQNKDNSLFDDRAIFIDTSETTIFE